MFASENIFKDRVKLFYTHYKNSFNFILSLSISYASSMPKFLKSIIVRILYLYILRKISINNRIIVTDFS